MYFLFRFLQRRLRKVKKKRKARLTVVQEACTRQDVQLPVYSSASVVQLSNEWNTNMTIVGKLALQQKRFERWLVRLRYIDICVLFFLGIVSIVALVVVSSIPALALEV